MSINQFHTVRKYKLKLCGKIRQLSVFFVNIATRMNYCLKSNLAALKKIKYFNKMLSLNNFCFNVCTTQDSNIGFISYLMLSQIEPTVGLYVLKCLVGIDFYSLKENSRD